jgi:PKD repeat protein
MKKSSIIFVCMIALVLIAPGIALSIGGYLDNFNAIYGTNGTRIDSCSLCHIGISSPRNNYAANWVSNGRNFLAIEDLDSDGDGVNNITEIDARFFPGDPNDFPVIANNVQPTADPNGPYPGTVGMPVAFDGSSSSDPDGTIVSYAWNFGDGNRGTGVRPNHTYSAVGTYNVSLTVTDNDGDSDIATTTATIVPAPNEAPTADPNGPYSGTAGVTAVLFDGSLSEDSDGSIVSYAWNFGDGSTGTGATPSHTYAAAGTYNVSLTVTDNDGATDTATTTASITDPANVAPIADPNGPYTGTSGTSVLFDGSLSEDSDGTIVSYAWDFGDGSTGTGATPSHTYAAAGTYNVSLTVTDNDGAIDTATTMATINSVPGNVGPTADPNGPYTGETGVAVAFDGSGSTDDDGTIVSYAWDFGDGNTGTGVAPSHTYGAAGTYDVSLTVTDDGGDSDTATTTATIAAGTIVPPTTAPPTTTTPTCDDDDDERDGDRRKYSRSERDSRDREYSRERDSRDREYSRERDSREKEYSRERDSREKD